MMSDELRDNLFFSSADRERSSANGLDLNRGEIDILN